MSSCFDDIPVEDLDNCANTDIAAGVSEVGIYYMPHAHATTIPMPLNKGDEGYTYETAVKVSTPIIAAAGKGFATVKVQPDTGEVKVEAAGNKGNKKLKQNFDFYVPGNAPKTLGFLRTHLNTPMIFIVTERDGQKRQLGDKYNPAWLTEVAGTTGKGGEDDKGVQFTIESFGVPIVYASTIQLLAPEEPAGP